ncbi:MAG TPA: serine/threonine-protein kinase [Actinomycetota bacterium]|nr:serine/threonine-protein kinase [Actinomycetota bacterium]
MNAQDPRIGTVVAGYRLDAFIGRGGMGMVYRAEDQETGTRGRKAAVKLLAPELAADERFSERFRQESQTAASIDHPNIIPIYEAGEEDGVLYIAMRYVEGDDLHAFLRRQGPLPANLALEIIGQVAAALDVAHLRGLVHRDVKPGNVLLVPSNDPSDPPHAYLTDFGLTKQVKATGGLTQVGQFVGTIDYVAPEQVQGKDVDPRTDVYALGCVLFECLTGQPPFRRDEEAAALWAHISEPPPPVTALRPDLPRELDEVVARALAKSPADRFSTCRELVNAVRWALSVPRAEPTAVAAAPPPTAGAATEAGAREPVSPPPGPPLATYPPPVAPSWPHQPAPARRNAVILWTVIGVAVLALVGTLAAVLLTRDQPERPFPADVAERQLLAAIPTELQTPPCGRGERPAAASAAAVCPDGAQRYTFYLYPDASSMNRAYNTSLATSGVRPDSGLTNCSEGTPGEDAWLLEDDPEDQQRGRALCYRNAAGAAVLEWTHDEFLIHAVAVRPDGSVQELHRVWLEEVPDYRRG